MNYILYATIAFIWVIAGLRLEEDYQFSKHLTSLTRSDLIQIALAAFGLTSAGISQLSTNSSLKQYAPVIGLAGQPAWAWFAFSGNHNGIKVIVIAFTLMYSVGVFRLIRCKLAARKNSA